MLNIEKKIAFTLGAVALSGVALASLFFPWKQPCEVYSIQNNDDHYSHTLVKDIDGDGTADYAMSWRSKEISGEKERVTVYMDRKFGTEGISMTPEDKEFWTAAMRAIPEGKYHNIHPTRDRSSAMGVDTDDFTDYKIKIDNYYKNFKIKNE